MHIDVILRDGTYHHFTPRVLDVLLETNRVLKFRRSNGWVSVDMEPVRRRRLPDPNEDDDYLGPERRISH
ncbi:MAG: hypothetical protein JRE63_09655 [Deltaproteobacteria bacterium]|nr:hypothetical protein [Deltaproteobacteria bacterium]